MVVRTMTRKARLSVTVSPELKAAAEEIAKENNTTPSGIVSQCLEELTQKRARKLMEEGYLAMAEEHRQFAKLSARATAEVVPSWD